MGIFRLWRLSTQDLLRSWRVFVSLIMILAFLSFALDVVFWNWTSAFLIGSLALGVLATFFSLFVHRQVLTGKMSPKSAPYSRFLGHCFILGFLAVLLIAFGGFIYKTLTFWDAPWLNWVSTIGGVLFAMAWGYAVCRMAFQLPGIAIDRSDFGLMDAWSEADGVTISLAVCWLISTLLLWIGPMMLVDFLPKKSRAYGQPGWEGSLLTAIAYGCWSIHSSILFASAYRQNTRLKFLVAKTEVSEQQL